MVREEAGTLGSAVPAFLAARSVLRLNPPGRYPHSVKKAAESVNPRRSQQRHHAASDRLGANLYLGGQPCALCDLRAL